MKVLYGIQGTGNGHLARARALVPELRKAGINMDFVFSGRAREDFFNMDVFTPEFRVYKGLSLVSERGRLDTLKTVRQNNVLQFYSDINNLDLSPYDLVLCDFEPITAWAAKKAKKTSIGISHQCAFDYQVPKVRGYTTSKMIMRFFAPTEYRIGLHWHHFKQPILPPLIEPQQAREIDKNKILVYMGFEAVDDIINFVKPFTDYRFIIYAKVNHASEYGHVSVQPLSHHNFHRDLEDCAGVISNCGFELASECLHLGKKLLTKPLLGQYEQLSNALALEYLQRGTVIHSLDQSALATWLEEKSPEAMRYPNVGKHLAAWLLKGDFANTGELVKKLWQDINASESFTEEFALKVSV